MTNNEVKKALYSQKPEAKLLYIKKNGIHYYTRIEDGIMDRKLFFKVPLEDLGDAEWLANMPAQLLLRYLID